MKLTGLDSRAGWVAKGWMKAQKLDLKCAAAKEDVVAEVQRRNNKFPADVTLKTITTYREIYRNDRMIGTWDVGPMFFFQCEKAVTKKLTAVLTDLKVDGQPLILRNSHTRITDLTYGPCPRN